MLQDERSELRGGRGGRDPRARDGGGGGDATPDAGAWRCVSCNAINGGGDERCIGLVGGRRCNRLRATGHRARWRQAQPCGHATAARIGRCVPVVRECERRVFELRRAQPLAATARTAGSALAASPALDGSSAGFGE